MILVANCRFEAPSTYFLRQHRQIARLIFGMIFGRICALQIIRMEESERQSGGKRSNRASDLTAGPLGARIFRFAFFLAATGILQQLFSAADVAIVGRFCGKAAMAAVGSNVPVVGFLLSLFVGSAIGANVVVANAIGRKDASAVRKAVRTAVYAPLWFGILAAFSLQALVEPILHTLTVPQEVYPMARAYLVIFLWGLPAQMVYNFAAALFRGDGDAKTPLYCLSAAGVVNVALNILFVAHFGMNADGVALATTIANYLAAISLLACLSRRRGIVRFRVLDMRIDWRSLAGILRIGLPSGLQGAIFTGSNLVVQNGINSLGTDIMAGSAAAFNIEILSYFVINAFGHATTTFVGQNFGAKKLSRCRHSMRIAFSQALICATVVAITLLSFSTPLLRLFNEDAAVIAAGRIRLFFIISPIWINAAIELYTGALRGYGISHIPAAITVVGVCVVRVIWMFIIFPMRPTFDMILWCYPVSWIITSSILCAMYIRHVRKISLEKRELETRNKELRFYAK